jgi:hypothetical protein
MHNNKGSGFVKPQATSDNRQVSSLAPASVVLGTLLTCLAKQQKWRNRSQFLSALLRELLMVSGANTVGTAFLSLIIIISSLLSRL